MDRLVPTSTITTKGDSSGQELEEAKRHRQLLFCTFN